MNNYIKGLKLEELNELQKFDIHGGFPANVRKWAEEHSAIAIFSLAAIGFAGLGFSGYFAHQWWVSRNGTRASLPKPMAEGSDSLTARSGMQQAQKDHVNISNNTSYLSKKDPFASGEVSEHYSIPSFPVVNNIPQEAILMSVDLKDNALSLLMTKDWFRGDKDLVKMSAFKDQPNMHSYDDVKKTLFSNEKYAAYRQEFIDVAKQVVSWKNEEDSYKREQALPTSHRNTAWALNVGGNPLPNLLNEHTGTHAGEAPGQDKVIAARKARALDSINPVRLFHSAYSNLLTIRTNNLNSLTGDPAKDTAIKAATYDLMMKEINSDPEKYADIKETFLKKEKEYGFFGIVEKKHQTDNHQAIGNPLLEDGHAIKAQDPRNYHQSELSTEEQAALAEKKLKALDEIRPVLINCYSESPSHYRVFKKMDNQYIHGTYSNMTENDKKALGVIHFDDLDKVLMEDTSLRYRFLKKKLIEIKTNVGLISPEEAELA